MNRKRPNIPVAVPNDDGSSTIVGSEELRAQREQRKTKMVSIDDGMARLVAAHKAGDKVRVQDILREMSAIKLWHMAEFGEDVSSISISTDFFDAIAGALARKSVSARNNMKDTKRSTAERDRFLQAAYEDRYSHLSRPAAAVELAKEYGALFGTTDKSGVHHPLQAGTIRKRIRKPRK